MSKPRGWAKVRARSLLDSAGYRPVHDTARELEIAHAEGHVEGHVEGYAEGIAEGRRLERGDVVAWLRRD
ncbi:MAG: hypothetical protein Q8S13_07275, partial [Dehalococcoidia bacterium]|nr:hypothetical protein [Dehalococcoidia bacterium]